MPDMKVHLFWILCFAVVWSTKAAPYYGTKIGSLKKFAHDVEGDVYAVDEKTIYLQGFSYDGQGPDAFFWGGITQKPDSTGFIIPDEKGKKDPLVAYRNRNILLRLPPGRTLRNIKWLSIWCRKFNANFGEILIPENLLIPQPVEIGKIPTKEHGVSSGPVMIVDTQTLLVPEFTYDGLGPAAYWWVSRGNKQHPRGTRLPDENGSLSPLPKYTGKTVVITLPEDKTIYDYDWFGVWCEEARVDFGSVQLPQNIMVPPSPRMLGVEIEYKLNCEVLHDEIGFEIRWIMDGEDIVIQLVAKLEPNEYMSFGLSKNDSRSLMVGADAIVSWIDKNNRGHAVDYFLGSKEQCVGRRGSCPDVRLQDGDDSVSLLNAATVNGYTMITFKRPQVGLDEKYDQHIYSDGPQAVIWAIGPLNNRDEVSYHGILRSEGDIFVDFARPPQWNCPQPADPTTAPTTTTTTTTTPKPTTVATRRLVKKPVSSTARKPTSSPSFERRRKPLVSASRTSSRVAEPSRTATSTSKRGWDRPSIVCPSDKTFRAKIGPSGGKKVYQSITGDVGWGLAWYIDGILIPEITVQRGKTYTFIVEGGMDPENSARQHPFYITDDSEGGYEHKTPTEKRKTKVYGGVARDRRGNYAPTALGRLCEYKLPEDVLADDFDTFEEFQQNLELKCERGKPGRLVFRPDENTPDLLYYQCYTHRYLGWKIHVVDSCSESSSALDTGASVTHLKNITLNNLQDKDEDSYKREPVNQKDTYHQDVDPYRLRPVSESFREEDAYLYQPEEEFAHTEPSTSAPYVRERTTEKQLYYRSTKSPSSSYYYYYSTQTPRTTAKHTYFRPTSQPAVYSKKPAPSTIKYVSPQTPGYKKPIYYSRGSISGKTTDPSISKGIYQTAAPESLRLHTQEVPAPTVYKHAAVSKAVIVKPAKNTGIRVTIYPSPNMQSSIRPTQPPLKVTTRSHMAWWKPEDGAHSNNKPHPGMVNRQKAVQTLKNQLSAIRGHQEHHHYPNHQMEANSDHIPINYHNGFLPIIVKNNGTFDRAVVDKPPQHLISGDGRKRHGHPPNKHVPVLVRTRPEAVRRANGKLKAPYFKTPLGNFPFPNSSSRRKSTSGQSSDVNGAFLPLLLPKGTFNGSVPTKKQKPSPPLIPIVVPEKKGDNLYVLHHVLSLITDNAAKTGQSVRVVDVNHKGPNLRARLVRRSADHHEAIHEDDDDHSSHDHDHDDPKKKNGCLSCHESSLSLLALLWFGSVALLRRSLAV